MNIYSLPPILALLFIIAPLSLFIKHINDKTSRKFSILFCLSVMWWQGLWIILLSVDDIVIAVFLAKLGYSGSIFIPSMCSDFINYIGTGKRSKFVKYILYTTFIFLPFIWFTDLFVEGVFAYDFGFYPKCGYLHLVHIFTTVILIFYTITNLLIEIKKGDRVEQSKSALISLVIFSFVAIDYIPNFGIEFYPFGSFLTITSFGYVLYRILFGTFANVSMINLKLSEEIKKEKVKSAYLGLTE